MNIKGYELVNEEKLRRAIDSSPTSGGDLIGGVGPDDEDAILANYDKLGGLITKDGYKIKTGSFFDFKANKAIAKPKPVYLVKVDGDEVEVEVGKEMPIEVKAQTILATSRKQKVADKKAKVEAEKAKATTKGKKGKAAASNEVEE